MVLENTTVNCEFCGEPLETKTVTLFGKQKRVTCYGSCGCRRSADRLASFVPSEPMPLPSDKRCHMCGGSMNLDGRTGYVSDCPWCGYSCVFASDLKRHNDDVRAYRNANKGGVLAGTGVPPLYWDVEPNYELAGKVSRTNKGFYIYGESNGTYKTLTACAIAKAYAEMRRSVRFVSSVKMLSEFKDAYGNRKSEAEVFEELNGCDLLIIDDMGKENPTSWAATMLYSVVDGRIVSKKPLIITTNFSEPALTERLAAVSDKSTAEAMMSRLFEMTEKLVMDGPDRRIA